MHLLLGRLAIRDVYKACLERGMRAVGMTHQPDIDQGPSPTAVAALESSLRIANLICIANQILVQMLMELLGNQSGFLAILEQGVATGIAEDASAGLIAIDYFTIGSRDIQSSQITLEDPPIAFL